MKADSKQHYLSSIGWQKSTSLDQIIIVEEIKMSLLAKSCFAPGIISFISNLIMSSGDEGLAPDDRDEEEWL